jgi:hypothetical protein
MLGYVAAVGIAVGVAGWIGVFVVTAAVVKHVATALARRVRAEA